MLNLVLFANLCFKANKYCRPLNSILVFALKNQEHFDYLKNFLSKIVLIRKHFTKVELLASRCFALIKSSQGKPLHTENNG